MPISSAPLLVSSVLTGRCTSRIASSKALACRLAAPLEMALPRLNIADQSLFISANSSLAAAMAVAVLSTVGVVPVVAAVQLVVQARLATTVASADELTAPARSGLASTVLTAPLSTAETSVAVLPLPLLSLIEVVEAAAPTATTTHWVLSPALPVPQPRSPLLDRKSTRLNSSHSQI